MTKNSESIDSAIRLRYDRGSRFVFTSCETSLLLYPYPLILMASKTFSCFCVGFLASLFLGAQAFSQSPKVEFKQSDDENGRIIRCVVDEKPLFTYRDSPANFEDLKANEYKTYISELYTPDGRNILRDSPADHVHHHALMFAIAADGVNFWEEYGKDKAGVQFAPTFSGNTPQRPQNAPPVLWKRVQWFAPGQKLILNERRIIRPILDKELGATLITWRTGLSVPQDKESVQLSGSHYYGLGMRFDQTMDKNGTFFCDAGSKIAEDNVRGDEKKTPCKWMAYTAELHGKPVTVAVFDSPDNPRPMSAFTMGEADQSFAYISATVDLEKEPITLEKDKPISFEYGVATWEGKQSVDAVQKAYERWLATRRPRR